MCLLTGGRLDLSRGAKHLPGRLVEHAHKKSQVWQTWSRLPSKVVSSFLLQLIHRQSPYYLLLPTCRVSPSLVKRRKTHFHQLPIGASIILGNNGLVWLHPSREEEGGGGIEKKSCNWQILPHHLHRWRRLGGRPWCGFPSGARSI